MTIAQIICQLMNVLNHCNLLNKICQHAIKKDLTIIEEFIFLECIRYIKFDTNSNNKTISYILDYYYF